MDPGTRVHVWLLVLVLGLVTVWFAWAAVPTVSAPMYGYEAWEVTTDDDEVVLLDRDGETRYPDRFAVSDRIACLSKESRACEFERQAVAGEASARYVGQYDYVYHDNGTMFGLTTLGPGTRFEGYERVHAAEAFSEVAIGTHRLTRTERDLLDDGSAITATPVPHDDRLLAVDGRYYTFVHRGRDSIVCIDNMESRDFCDDSETRRDELRLGRIGLGALGAIGVLVGGFGLAATARAWRQR